MATERDFGFRRIMNYTDLGRLILVLLALFLVHPITGYTQTSHEKDIMSDSEATFEDNTNGTDTNANLSKMAADFKEKFKIKLYLDFMYETALGDNDENDPLRDPDNASFDSNHTYLLISANPTDRLRIGFDITFNDYYEIEYALTPKLFVKGGLIFLPFGDFKYHAIYGGKVYSIDNDLFPNWFTDYGLAIEHDLLDLDNLHLRYGAFVSNGFQEGFNGNIDMNDIGFGQDNNDDKAFGGRVKATLFGGYTATASAMYDRWDDDGDAELRLLALELATTRGLFNLPVLNRLNIKVGFLDNHVENEAATDPLYQDYNAFGSYAELSVKATNQLRFAIRAGEVDPNEDVDDQMDQTNYNISCMYSVDKNLHLFAMYQLNEEVHGDEVDNDYLMLKAIVEF